ncbi:MAG: hypothetical protein ABH814_03520 [bacterium]
MTNKRHLIHYLILIALLAVSLVLFYLFHFYPVRQFFVITAASLAYMAWGIIHHAQEDRMILEVLLEYFLIGGVVIVGAWLTLL